MIHRLRKVTDQLYRGSAPSPKDVQWLQENLGIKKIVSLDKISGDRINRTTKLLGIKHIMLPIEMPHLRHSLLIFLKHDLKKLLLEGGPTYVHCAEGKDRTGLAIALIQCKYLGKDPEEAIEEAKSLGFGLDVEPGPIHLFEKVIRSCKPISDTNNADIVSNEREYIGDNRDSYLDEGHQSSFAPYLDPTKQYPTDTVYRGIDEQSPTRENYHAYKSIKEHDKENDSVPQVGIFNNDAGGRGFGPTENAGGFFYD
jgi:hypothetical protein